MIRWTASLLLLVLAHPAAAQETCRPCEMDDAARQATSDGRLTDADRILTELLELDPKPATAFNLALVRESRGALVQARSLFERLLSGEWGDLPPERRSEVAERLAAVSSQLAVVVVMVDSPGDANVRVDGRPRGMVLPGGQLRLTLDPGSHIIQVSTAGRAEERSVELIRGARETLSFEVPEPLPPPEEGVAEAPRRPLRVGLVVAATVLLAGASVGIAFALRANGGGLPRPPESFLGSAEALVHW